MKDLSINCEKGLKVKKTSVQKLISEATNILNKRLDFLEINFVNAKTILRINNQFLGHNYVTDVISFDYSNENNSFDGEIFICSEIALENSKRYDVSFDDELKRLVIHGMLHFSGYDDKTSIMKRKMRKMENSILEKSGRIKLSY